MTSRDFDWKPLALVPLLALIVLPFIGSPSTWLTLTVAGLAMGMIIFIIASGLTLVFGLMDVLNFGHGVFIALGAFVATSVLGAMGDWTGSDQLWRNMVAVSRAIVEPRDLLIVDEPSKGLAPAIINNMINAFQQLKASGTTILLVEQNIHFAKRLGDHVAVMDDGRVVHAGTMQALAQDEALQQRLLGLAL